MRGLQQHVPLARSARRVGAPASSPSRVSGSLSSERSIVFYRVARIPRRMAKRDLLRRKVEDIEVARSAEVASLVESMGRGGGFTAKKIAVGVDILRTVFRRRSCTTFLSFPAALIATGVRGVLRTLVERNLVDVRLTAAGTADHDLARVWRPYYQGDFEMDDGKLHLAGINRPRKRLGPNQPDGIILEQENQTRPPAP